LEHQEFRIATNGHQFKVQKKCRRLFREYWSDCGSPGLFSGRTSYFDSLKDARKYLAEIEKIEARLRGEWKAVWKIKI